MRKELNAIQPAVERNLHKAEHLNPIAEARANPGAQIDDRPACGNGVGEHALVGALIGDVYLKFGNDFRVRRVACAEIYGNLVAGAIVLPWLVQLMRYRDPKLPIDESIEILADRLIVVRTDEEPSGAGASLQAGVEQIVG